MIFTSKSFLLSSSALILGCTLSLTPVRAMEPDEPRSTGLTAAEKGIKRYKPANEKGYYLSAMKRKYPMTTHGNKALRFDALVGDDEARDEMILRYFEASTTRYLDPTENIFLESIIDPRIDLKNFLEWPDLRLKILNKVGYAWVLFHNFEGEYQKKFPKVVQAIQRSAEKDKNPIAQDTMGLMHQMGYGVEQSPEKAEEYYLMAARQGYARSQRELGFMYQKNNPKEAAKWTQRAAKLGDAGAQHNYYWIYKQGLQKDTAELEAFAKLWEGAARMDDAENVVNSIRNKINRRINDPMGANSMQATMRVLKWLKRAAEQNDPKAQYDLGCLHISVGVPEEGVQWLQKAADQNYVYALVHLAEMYRDSVEQDSKKAIELYRTLASCQNNSIPPAALAAIQNELAFLLLDCPSAEKYTGEALDLARKMAKRTDELASLYPEEAAKWTLWAAELRYAADQHELGGMYQPIKFEESANLTRRATTLNDPTAQYELGLTHYKINNPEEAVKWLQKSTDIRAKAFLAEMYRDGHIVKQDSKKAIELYRTVADYWLHAKADPNNPPPALLASMAQMQLAFMLLDCPEAEQYPGEALELSVKLLKCLKGQEDPEGALASKASELKSRIAHKKDEFYETGLSYLSNNPTEAVKWLKRAATLGHPKAECELGLIYKKLGNFEKAIEYFQRAAKYGDADVQYELGLKSKKENQPDSAARWFKDAADQGHVYASFSLAEMYRDGYDHSATNRQVMKALPPSIRSGHTTYSVVKHSKEAIELFRRLTDPNNAIPPEMALRARIHLAFLLLNYPEFSEEAMKLANGAATEADNHCLSLLNTPTQGARWSLWAAELRHAMVQSQSGLKYQPLHCYLVDVLTEQHLSLEDQELLQLTEYELGVMHFRFNDPEGGMKWIERAAAKGNTGARVFLNRLRSGQSFKVPGTELNTGMTISGVELSSYMLQAAESGSSRAMISLVNRYLRIQTPDALAKAFFWIKKAQELNDPYAQALFKVATKIAQENQEPSKDDETLVKCMESLAQTAVVIESPVDDSLSSTPEGVDSPQESSPSTDSSDEEEAITADDYTITPQEIKEWKEEQAKWKENINNPKFVREKLREAHQSFQNKQEVKERPPLSPASTKTIKTLRDKGSRFHITIDDLFSLFKDPYFQGQVDMFDTTDGYGIISYNFSHGSSKTTTGTHRKHNKSYKGLDANFLKSVAELVDLYRDDEEGEKRR
ncbi:MAG: tetratricopeptide repeat protein [Alphaproteobacteria bacterium]|nr:tetratricopeptide repeat protein [Alphaproteobacteria bacterium]